MSPRRTNEVWIVTMGTRGDLQPFAVLALSLQRAGCGVHLFGPPDLGVFCKDPGLRFTRLCKGWREHKSDAAAQEPDEAAASPANLAFQRHTEASSSKSDERRPAFAVDGKPGTRWTSVYSDNQWIAVDLGKVYNLARVEIRWEVAHAKTYKLLGSRDGKVWRTLVPKEIGREGWVVTELPEFSEARWVKMQGERRATQFGFSIWDLRVYERTKEYAKGSSSSSPASTFIRADDETFRKTIAEAGIDLGNAGDVGHMLWLWNEMPTAIDVVEKALAEATKMPDVVIFNHLMVNVGAVVWRKHGIRTLFANLGLEFHFAPSGNDAFNYYTLSAVDNAIVKPRLGVAPVAEMSHEQFTALYTSSERLLGTTALIKEALPVEDREVYKDWAFTGFWVPDAEQQQQMDDPETFGGKEVQKQLQDFLTKFPRPVYMGWGSMGVPPKMLTVAIGALQKLSLKAVIVKGWSHVDGGWLSWIRTTHFGVDLSNQELDGLCKYAEKNVCFVDQAPHEWLFPQCSCTVHHGGAGTTAAALRAGVPTVVVPLCYDQPYHGEWVAQLGVGVKTSFFMELELVEMEAALRLATSDDGMRERAREVAETLRQEPGVAGAVDKVCQVIRDDVRSGDAKRRWEEEQAART